MKKVLVTGATGFVGNHVIKELVKTHHHIIATSVNEEKAKEMEWYDRVAYIAFNVESFDAGTNYYQYFGQPDLAIHLAWEGLPNYKATFHTDINLPRHSLFLENLLKNGLRDLTVTGTCFEYGMIEGCLSEDMPVTPANAYAIAKNKLREYLQQLRHSYPYRFKWIRLFYLYGKGQNPNSLLSQLQRALENGEPEFKMSGGKQLRDYLSIEKTAEYIVKIALQNELDGIINCCSGKPISVEEFVRAYLRENNKKISLNLGYYPYSDYEPMNFWGDTKKLKRILNDEPGSAIS